MPAGMNKKLFNNLHLLGKGLAENGVLDPDVLRSIAKPERLPAYSWPIV